MLGFVLGVVSRDVVITSFVAMEQEVAVNGRERGELALRRGVISRDVLYAWATTIRGACGPTVARADGTFGGVVPVTVVVQVGH